MEDFFPENRSRGGREVGERGQWWRNMPHLLVYSGVWELGSVGVQHAAFVTTPGGKDDKNMHQMLEKKPGPLFTKSYFQSELVSPVQFITDCSAGLPKTFVPTWGEKSVRQHDITAKILFHVAKIEMEI